MYCLSKLCQKTVTLFKGKSVLCCVLGPPVTPNSVSGVSLCVVLEGQETKAIEGHSTLGATTALSKLYECYKCFKDTISSVVVSCK